MKNKPNNVIIMTIIGLGLIYNSIDAVTFENNTDVSVDVIILTDKVTIKPHQSSIITPTIEQITIEINSAGFKTYRSKLMNKKSLPKRYIITIDENQFINIKGLNKTSSNTITFENNSDITINIKGPLGNKDVSPHATYTMTPQGDVASYTMSSTGFTSCTTNPITIDSLPRSFIITVDEHKKINFEQI